MGPEKDIPHLTDSCHFFGDVSLGIKGGGYFYTGGWGKYFKPELPVIGVSLRSTFPFLSERFGLEGEFLYFAHTLKPGNGSAVQHAGLSGRTDNYQTGLNVFYDLPLGHGFYLMPKAGGGMIFQATTVTGTLNASFNNNIPFALAGIGLRYKINRTVALTVTGQTVMEIEKKIYTYVNSICAGVEFSL